ncbi:hypothetical protein FGRMN_3855 [Fusarium graminum]|nr:hypothetical protein FGRMN_3855 [Fusarium graminum]
MTSNAGYMVKDMTGSTFVKANIPYLARDELFKHEKPYGADFAVDEIDGASITNYVFDTRPVLVHNIRLRSTAFPNGHGQKVAFSQPATIPHTDFSVRGAYMWMKDIFPGRICNYERRSFDLLNVWKVLRGPNDDWPLAVCDYTSIDVDDDTTTNDALHLRRTGENWLLYPSDKHRWFYQSSMEEDDLIVFRNTDSDGVRSHTPVLSPGALKLANMSQDKPNPSYDEEWTAAVQQLVETLEHDDRRQVNEVVDASDLRSFLEHLIRDDSKRQTRPSCATILASLEHIERFSDSFATDFSFSSLAKVLWGTIFLSIKLAAENNEAMRQISTMIKRLGQKVEIYNELCRDESRPKQMKEAAGDMHVDMISFFVAAIRFLREEVAVVSAWSAPVNDTSWTPLIRQYTTLSRSIEDIFSRIERLHHLLQRNQMQETFSTQQSILKFASKKAMENAKLPCIKLPPTKNRNFYDRTNILEEVDAYFFPEMGERSFRSIVLYGMGGVGKSHAAQKYCQQKALKRGFQAIVWIEAETPTSLAQSFTDFAIQLGLPDSGRDRHDENRIGVLNWLQRTESDWLLVFDNGEDVELLLQYWPPACSSGCILITSRNHNIQYGPADFGIEVMPFNPEDGSKMLLNLLRMDLSNAEADSALELAEQMSGHALAISIVAGLIQRRSWKIQEFLDYYEKQKAQLHGSGTALSTIWNMSFASLNPESAILLGVLSYLNPDCIQEVIFNLQNPSDLPASLKGPLGRFYLHETLEPLHTLALVKRDKDTKTLTLHRLVQTQYIFFMKGTERQEAFNAAVRLMFHAFPRGQGQLYDKWERCQMNLEHILILKRHYKKERNDPIPIKPTMEFCWLLGDCARYLVETADLLELEDVLAVALSSFDQLQEADRNYDIYAGIVNGLGLMWSHRGFFARGAPHLLEAYRLKRDTESPNWVAIAWQENNIANNYTSMGKYEIALEFGLRAVSSRSKSDQPDTTQSKSVILRNLGRCYMHAGQSQKALDIYKQTLDDLQQSENWAGVALTYFSWATLDRRLGDLSNAAEKFQKAQEAWLDGGKMKTHQFNAACLYRLGCVADDLGHIDEAINFLREALVITKMKETVMQGDYARVVYKLSMVERKKKGHEVDAILHEVEADRIRSAVIESATLASEEVGSLPHISSLALKDENSERNVYETSGGEDDYDSLVYVLWR